jgi:hypothetical protein
MPAVLLEDGSYLYLEDGSYSYLESTPEETVEPGTDLRARVYGLLRHDPVLQTYWGDRIYQRSAMEFEVPPSQRPFGVYHLDMEAPVFTPSALRARTRSVQVWVHDEPGDYHVIDQTLDRVRQVLEGAVHSGPFLEMRLTLRSPDLFDDLLKTIMRYSRFDAVFTR